MSKPNNGYKGGKIRAPRVRVAVVQTVKDVCISTNCGVPRKPPRIKPEHDPRIIRPKKPPKTKDI